MRWRAGLRRAWRRVRTVGVLGWLQLERDAIVQMARTALAAALAWELSQWLLGSELPALASLAAVIISQITIYQTVARAVQYVIAVVLGLLAALLLATRLGVHAWSVGILIFVALVVGRSLRLGQLANQAAVSALLVMSLGVGYGMERAYDAVLGGVVGILVNMALPPPTYVEAAGRALRGIAEDLGELSGEIASLLRGGRLDQSVSGLEQAREISGDVRAARDAVARGEEGIRYHRRGRADMVVLRRHGEALRALSHGATQLRGIARTLADMRHGEGDLGPGSREVLVALAEVVSAAGQAARRFGRLQSVRPELWAAELERLRGELEAGSRARTETARRLAAVPHRDGPVARQLGSMLVDAERMLGEFDPDGAHAEALPR